jgi:hypothetical protein
MGNNLENKEKQVLESPSGRIVRERREITHLL